MEAIFEQTVRDVIGGLIKPDAPLREQRIKLAVETILMAHNLTVKK